MKGKAIFGVGALAVLIAAGTVLAQGPHGGRGGQGKGDRGDHGMGIMRAVHQVSNLTETQEEQIDKIVLDLHKQMRALRKEKAEERDELQDLVKAGASDKEIAAKVEEVSKEQAAVMKTHALAMRDVVKILTDAQREELFAEPEGGPHKGGARGGRR